MRTKLANVLIIGAMLAFVGLGVFMSLGRGVQARVGTATSKMVGTISHRAGPTIAPKPTVAPKRNIIPRLGGFYVGTPSGLCYISVQESQTLGERWFIVSHSGESAVLDFNRNGFIPIGKATGLSELSFHVIKKDALKPGEDYRNVTEGDPRFIASVFSFRPDDDFKSATLLLKSADEKELVLELKDSEPRKTPVGSAKP